MLREYREPFNQQFTPQKYTQFLSELYDRCGVPVAFRNCETPCFFPEQLMRQMAEAGAEMSLQLAGDPSYLEAADQQIPTGFAVPNVDARPLFIQADFGIIKTVTGNLEPRLVEIQGFPSLYAYQIELAQTYAEVFGVPDTLTPLLGGRSAEQYRGLLCSAIVGQHAPENTVLLEVDPWNQKTLADFLLTKKLCGVPIVDIAEVEKQGRRLFYPLHGKMIPIHRIYNRVIVDELVRKQIPLGFDFSDDLEVEWAGHPNWFYRISKFSIPFLKHPFVPESQFLRDVTELPANPEELVLKPLFSFAGLGVKVGPSEDEIRSIPAGERGQYLLQERMRFEPLIHTPFGPTFAEVRIMYIWTGAVPEPVTTIVRMGRGKMMGVDQNRNLEWVGASAGFVPRPMVS